MKKENQELTKKTDRIQIDTILRGDCIEIMQKLPEASVDLVFADPPYNLQLSGELWRPNQTRVNGVEESWDKFEGFQAYDAFTLAWLKACRRILKEDGTLWVIGTYHNIFRVGAVLQDLGYWILNDVLWIKTNPMPNFRGVRFTNAHETLLWACKSKESSYLFNHQAMKGFNDGKQLRSDWRIPICSGKERIRTNGSKAHPTQKPEALLYRVLLSSTKPGDLVLDPFFGTGTTGAVAKKLHRHWIGIEKEKKYIKLAQKRIDAIQPEVFETKTFDVEDRRRKAPRVAFATLLEHGYISPGQELRFRGGKGKVARVKPDGNLRVGKFEGSIHQAARYLINGKPCNGWDHWYFKAEDGEYQPIDDLRQTIRRELKL